MLLTNLVLFLIVLTRFSDAQFLSYDAIRMRVPGRCVQGDYDCGLGQCVPIQQFRDGKPDCMDGSDEWCFIGQVSCGAVYCADYKDMLPCLVNPKCDGSSKQLPWCSISKEKLCADKTSFPCKGYGECVLWEWLLDGKKDCIDGSDEDENYVLPLEASYRFVRNKTGLILPQPIPPPPEDHPSLYVEGCSFCPHAEKHTTPKNPFSGNQKTIAPLTNFGMIPNPTLSPGEFFPAPADIMINRLTTTPPIDDFFVTDSTTPATHNVIFVPVKSEESPAAASDFFINPDTTTRIPMITPIGAIFKPIQPGLSEKIENYIPENTNSATFIKSTIQAGSENSEKPMSIATSSPEQSQAIFRPVGSGKPGEFFPWNPQTTNSPTNMFTKASPSFPIFIMPTENPKVQSVIFRPSGSSGLFEKLQPTDSYLKPENVHPSIKQPGAIFRPSGSLGGSGRLTEIGTSSETYQPGAGSTNAKITTTDDTNYQTNSGGAVFRPSSSSIPNYRKSSEIDTYETHGKNSGAQFKPVGPPAQKPWEPTQNPDFNRITQPAVFRPWSPSKPSKETYEVSGNTPWKITPNSEIQPTPSNSLKPTDQSGAIFRPSGQNPWNPPKEIPHQPPGKVAPNPWMIPNIGPTPPPPTLIPVIIPENQTPGPLDPYSIPERVTVSPSSPGYTPETDFQTSTSNEDLVPLLPGHLLPTFKPTIKTTTPIIPKTTEKSEEGWIEESTTELSETTTDLQETSEEVPAETTTTSPSPSQCFVQKQEDIICDCENGKMKNRITGECEESPSIMNVKVDMKEICGDSEFEDKQHYLFNKLSSKYDVCIRSSEFSDGSSLVASISCVTCSITDINNNLKSSHLEAAGLGSSLCDDSDYNHCHYDAECFVEPDGLRYTCKCKPGTTDVSSGSGRDCEGIPDDSQCILVFDICLIVWVIFLFGVFMLTCLCCIAAYSLCPKRCGRHVAIHPENADGLRTVVIGKNAKKSKEQMPHMRAIFAESLKHSAKGSTSVASAFALAEMKKKRVSKAPEMSQVIEEVNESPVEYEKADVISGHRKISKAESIARLSDTAITETPILEKHSSSVSLVSAGNEPAPQLPNLPLSLPIPVTTNREPTPPPPEQIVEESKKSETERPSSSHSIGVQPTIWETYRVLGQQYSKSDQNERKQSLDSLELLFEARQAETHRTESSPPITFTAKQTLEVPQIPQPIVIALEEPTTSFQPEVPIVSDPVSIETERIEHNLQEAAEVKQHEVDEKVAEMIGVTSYHPTPSPQLVVTQDEEIEELQHVAEDDSLGKSLESALLIEMAKQGIELPLSPKTPVPTLDELEKTLAEQREIEDSEEQKVIEEINRKIESRRSSTSQKSKIPSRKGSVSSTSSRKSEVFKPSGSKSPKLPQKFRPKGLERSMEVTDDSDPEVAFFKRLDAMRDQVDRRVPFLPPPRRVIKRRVPERTLSSISEKSAEILTDPEAVDVSISCPVTTRSHLDPMPKKSRFAFKRKVIEATSDSSDVDVPSFSRKSPPKPIVASPEIPDVTLQRSIEHLNKTDIDIASPSEKSAGSVKSTKPIYEKHRKPIPPHPSSITSSRMSSRVVTPRTIGEDSASQTSRSTRHSVISRKIAIRKHELKSISGSTADLSKQVSKTPSTIRSAKSVGDISHRPAWNISQHRTNSQQPIEFLPPITPTRPSRTAGNSPQPRNRRSDSHFSLTSLPAAHSPTSFWSSPHFNPSEDSRKPPKEDLWWNPNKK
ncbi:unnamed protein product [Caenorhabditis angaria]|uniref:EGF-like domain-containing protein n=1 Tax=Caenorhabditis angaria TaxID=860376 RepID=A0A9P1NAI2_9PELO|nr:unnamed protein product [Caenorhabditis angaria]